MIMCSTVPPGPALEPMPRIQLEGAGALRLWARDAWLSSESDRRPVGRRAASVLNQQPWCHGIKVCVFFVMYNSVYALIKIFILLHLIWIYSTKDLSQCCCFIMG
jgi:hypothetical protein